MPVEAEVEVGKLVVYNPESAFLHTCLLGVCHVVSAVGMPVVDSCEHLVDACVYTLLVVVAYVRLLCGIQHGVYQASGIGFGLKGYQLGDSHGEGIGVCGIAVISS